MGVRWGPRGGGTFEIVDRQGPVAVLFGCAMLVPAGLFLYWFGTSVAALAREASGRDLLYSVPGLGICLFMAGLFGIPGMLMAFLSRRTEVLRYESVIRSTTRYGVFRRTREILLTEVRLVAAVFRTTKGRRSSAGWIRGGAEVHTVEIELSSGQRVELAKLGKWTQAEALGQQLAAFLEVEFRSA